MPDVPEVRYTRAAGDVTIAYQVFGDGPDLLFHQGWVTNVEQQWDIPEYDSFLRRLGSFARVVLFDKRGVGLSDRGVGMPALEDRADDARAVLDALDISSAHVFAESEGGPMGVQLAATHPDRVRSLLLYGTYARQTATDEYPWGTTAEDLLGFADVVEAVWGRPESADVLKAWHAGAAVSAESVGATIRCCRQSASPREAADALRRNVDLDVRAILPTISVPTLVLHRAGDQIISADNGRYLAEHVDGARYVELAGRAHAFQVGDTDSLLLAIQQWMTGEASVASSPDRVLATVMFSDIVESTDLASQVGDRRWRELLDRHDRLTADLVRQHRGRWIKSTGDGALATFDGPARAVRCAHALRHSMAALGIELRVGIHAGEIELRDDDIGGIAVHTAARVQALAAPGEVLVSSTIRDLVAGSELTFIDRGVHTLKGISGEWRVLASTEPSSTSA